MVLNIPPGADACQHRARSARHTCCASLKTLEKPSSTKAWCDPETTATLPAPVAMQLTTLANNERTKVVTRNSKSVHRRSEHRVTHAPDSTTHTHSEITVAFEANYTTETTEVVTFIETPYSVTKETETFIRYKWNTVETKEETTTTTTIYQN